MYAKRIHQTSASRAQSQHHVQLRRPRLARLLPTVVAEHILNCRCGGVEKAVFLVEGGAVLPKQVQDLGVVEATGPGHTGMACGKQGHQLTLKIL